MQNRDAEIALLKNSCRQIAYRLELLKFYTSAEALHKWEKATTFLEAPQTPIEKDLILEYQMPSDLEHLANKPDVSPNQLTLPLS